MQRRQCPNFEIRFAYSSSTLWLIPLIPVDKWGFLPLRSSEITSSPHILFSSSEQKDNTKNNLSGSAWKGHFPHSPIFFPTKLGDPETLSFAVFIDKEASFPRAAPPGHLHSALLIVHSRRERTTVNFLSIAAPPATTPSYRKSSPFLPAQLRAVTFICSLLDHKTRLLHLARVHCFVFPHYQIPKNVISHSLVYLGCDILRRMMPYVSVLIEGWS